jgi:hypothetical protein
MPILLTPNCSKPRWALHGFPAVELSLYRHGPVEGIEEATIDIRMAFELEPEAVKFLLEHVYRHVAAVEQPPSE